MITVKADDKQRVRLPKTKPGQIFEVVVEGNGNFRLALIQSRTGKRSVLDGLKPMSRQEAKKAFRSDPEWDALEEAMCRRPVPRVEE